MTYTVSDTDAGKRLDSYLAEVADMSRSAASKLIESGEVTVGGKKTEKKYQLKAGDEIEVNVPEAEEYEALPENIPLSVVYEDADIIVINKPSGMVVHPAPGNYTGTLVNALLYHCKDSLSGIGGVMRPGIVHRIDKDTSGLLVVAKNDFSHRALSEELGYHGIEREYHALVRGGFKEEAGTVDLPIGRHHTIRKKMAVTSQNSKEAATNYKTLEVFRGYSLCEFRLETGRTHQIRVHASYFGHAVAGDPLYAPLEGKNPFNLMGQCLHAETLGIVHPRTGEYMEFNAPLPPHFEKTLELLRKNFN